MTGPPPPRRRSIARKSCDCSSVTSRARWLSVGAGAGSSLADARAGDQTRNLRVVSVL